VEQVIIGMHMRCAVFPIVIGKNAGIDYLALWNTVPQMGRFVALNRPAAADVDVSRLPKNTQPNEINEHFYFRIAENT